MRRLGKCDACRKRKVKCDENKPSCGSCQRGSRTCNYLYPQGPGFALVLQDPSQMTRYGRSMAASVIYPLSAECTSDDSSRPDCASASSPDQISTPNSDVSDLHLRGGMVAADGRGVFQTLAPGKSKAAKPSKRLETNQRKRLHEHLLRLQRESSLSVHRPTAPDTRLAATFINMLRPESPKYQPLFTLGDWVTSIPPRIGSSPVVTMAAKFLVHSFDCYVEDSHSNKIQAMQTKSKALKELQLSLLASQEAPTYDLLLATKMHYASEVLLGVTNLHYAIHTLGLMDLLRSGILSGADEKHFWNILDNTYIDDVTMAMTAGRPSIYDNDVYLSSTHPATLGEFGLDDREFISRAMMHVIVQCPRLTTSIRHAIRTPDDVDAVASAVSHAEHLWRLTRQKHFVDYINASVKTVANCNDNTVVDILGYGIDFDLAQEMVIATRYWLLQIFLCGTLDTLLRKFPVQFAMSLLPGPAAFHGIDVSAAIQLARVVLALGRNPSPLTLIRTHGPFSGSIGAWHRQIRYLSMTQSRTEDSTGNDMARNEAKHKALRMKKWVLNNCNVILNRLHITQVDEAAWMEALDCMAGEELPDWIPTKVSFGTEDGEIIMKLEYSGVTANGDPRVRGSPSRVFNVRNPAQFGPQHLRDWIKGSGGPVISKGAPETGCVVETASPDWLYLGTEGTSSTLSEGVEPEFWAQIPTYAHTTGSREIKRSGTN